MGVRMFWTLKEYLIACATLTCTRYIHVNFVNDPPLFAWINETSRLRTLGDVGYD